MAPSMGNLLPLPFAAGRTFDAVCSGKCDSGARTRHTRSKIHHLHHLCHGSRQSHRRRHLRSHLRLRSRLHRLHRQSRLHRCCPACRTACRQAHAWQTKLLLLLMLPLTLSLPLSLLLLLRGHCLCCHCHCHCGHCTDGTDVWGRQHMRINNKTSRESPRGTPVSRPPASRCGNTARNLTGAPCLLSKFVCCVGCCGTCACEAVCVCL